MRNALVLSAALVSLIALSACAPTASPVPVPSASSATEGPAAEQTRETGLVPPARPFDGDCANLMTEAEASQLLGDQLVLSSYHTTDFAPSYAVELHAGLNCRWTSEGYGKQISAVILPEGTVVYDAPGGCLADDVERITPLCEVDATANGSSITGAVVAEGETVDFVRAATDSFMALFEQRAAAYDPSPIPIPAVGAWANPTDCAAVVAAGDFSTVPGVGAGAVGTEFPFGGHANTNAAEVALVGSATPYPYCWIDGESADVTFVASGGGRWLESQATAGASPFAIDGYESAYTSPGEEGLTKVDVFHGPNWLHFQVKYTKNAKFIADALFAALDATAAR